MEQKELKQKILEYYQKLPTEMQDEFSSMRWMDELRGISRKYSLNGQQVEVLGVETTLVLLGIIHVDEYVQNLFSQIKIPEEVFDQLIVEIDNKILMNSRNKFIEVFKKNNSELEQNNNKPIRTLNSPRVSYHSGQAPANLEEVVAKSGYQDKSYDIGHKYGLSIDEIGILEGVVTKILNGQINSRDFGNEIRKKIDIPNEKLNDFITDINESIFKNIRENLKGNERVEVENEKLENKEGEGKFEIKNDELENKEEEEGDEYNDFDEVPRPPYEDSFRGSEQPKDTRSTELKKSEELLKERGIEVIDDNQSEEEPNLNVEAVNKKDNAALKDRGIDIIEDKLSGPTISPKTTVDYSSQGISSVKKDPYREEI